MADKKKTNSMTWSEWGRKKKKEDSYPKSWDKNVASNIKKAKYGATGKGRLKKLKKWFED